MTEREARLPELRQELRLLDGGRDGLGQRRWLVHDELRHRFFTIDRRAFTLLSLWQPELTRSRLAEAAWTRHSESVDAAEIDALVGFLRSNGLLVAPPGSAPALVRTEMARRAAVGSRLLHGYLFFRVPLARPEAFLKETIALVRPLASKAVAAAIAVAGLLGLYLASREWEAFLTTLADVFSFEGAALMAVAMVLVKVVHELGHAYVAHHYGCRVPVLGVAFVLGVPMLYCDVTESWRLPSSRRRMAIASAGILVDLSIACLALLAWAFLPPGILRNVAFSLAMAGFIFSLVMNLNPFMKFDGYHMLVDATGLDNLQDRAMEVARWHLREVLFGLKRPPPEPLPRRIRGLVVAYGFATWLYRLVLFVGIALAVYAFFFKLAGVILFLVEIVYFIAAPLWRELKEWFAMRRAILHSPRSWLTAAILVLAVAGISVPWVSDVTVPAVLEAGDIVTVHPAVPARIEKIEIARGDRVEAGRMLVVMRAPVIEEDLALTELRAAVVEVRQARRASDSTDREEAVVLDQQRRALAVRREGLLAQKRELSIRAPVSGVVVETAPALRPGRWIGVKEPLLVIRSDSRPRARGYLDEADVWRIKTDARARFVPDDLMLPPVAARVTMIASAGSPVIDQVELAASFGGRVPDRLDAQRRPVPVSAQYALRADVEGPLAPGAGDRAVPGILHIEGTPESLAARFWRRVLKVLVRESGL